MMRLSHFVIPAILLALAGCVAEPAAPEIKPDTSTSGAESNQRTRARLHTELAAGYLELGNMGVALEEVNIALSADSGYGPAYNVAGLVYSGLKEDRLAEQNFEQALRINALDPDANNNYGWFLCQRNREEQSIKYFLAAVRNPLYRTPERAYLNAGLCSRRRGDLAGAEQYFQSTLKLRPGEPQALYQMADLAYARGDYSVARDYLGRYTKVAPASAEVLWLGLRIERKRGDHNSEASYALQLRRNFPDSKETRALLAGQYE